MMPETILIQGRNQYGPLARRLDYAAELEELSANSLGRVKWKPPKVAEVVDRRVVVKSAPGARAAHRGDLRRPALARASPAGVLRVHVLRRAAARWG
jgi:hypothetical protein